MDPRFIRPRNDLSTRPPVAGPDGRWSETTSQAGSSSDSDSAIPMCRSSARARTCSLRSGFASARTSIPNARARWATSSPIEPSPRMPIVEPNRPRAAPYAFLFQRPARRSTVPSTIRRSTASRRPIVSSATATAFRPGRLATRTPRAAAAPVSMVFVPAPARMTRASRSAFSKTSRLTLVLRTTSASNPSRLVGRSAAVSPASTTQVWPRASRSVTVDSPTASAKSTRIVTSG